MNRIYVIFALLLTTATITASDSSRSSSTTSLNQENRPSLPELSDYELWLLEVACDQQAAEQEEIEQRGFYHLKPRPRDNKKDRVQ